MPTFIVVYPRCGILPVVTASLAAEQWRVGHGVYVCGKPRT